MFMHNNTASIKSENPTKFHVCFHVFLKRQDRRIKMKKKIPYIVWMDDILYTNMYTVKLVVCISELPTSEIIVQNNF